MKKLALFSLLIVFTACSQQPGAGSSDFSSLDQDMGYHVQSEDTNGVFSYTRMDLLANGNFTQTEAQWTSSTSGKKCSLTGTWAMPTPDVNSAAGNELVITVTQINGAPVGPLEKRYDLREVNANSLKVKYTADADLVDMTNVNEALYPEFSAVDTSALTDDTFCSR